MSKRATAAVLALAAGTFVAGTAAPAHAEKPSWAGKPMVERVPVVDSDPPTFLCGDKTIDFTSGTVIFQVRELPKGGFLGLIKLRGARASDGTTTYAAHGGGMVRSNKAEVRFRITVTFVGPRGEVHRVNSTATMSPNGMSVVDRGTCTVDEF